MAPTLDDIKTVGDLTLFRTGMHYDTVVHCKGVHWTLHKSILSSRCEWFKEKLAAAKPQEGRPAVITIYEFPSDLVNTLLRFIYTAQVWHPCINDHRVVATLYNMSTHFQLPKLGSALVAEMQRRTGVLVSVRRRSGSSGGRLVVPRRFTKKQLDELVEAVRIAYNGDRV
ncbi:hypothetical protein PG996_006528 [Apiospora saccharicola]|uniref:BTB domain-containing protein n=1 Tax=Apiospora saccharicola TaxID=335842 RepID=A0ABR1VAR2_9PEZI